MNSIRPLFNTDTESNDRDFKNKIKIISQNTQVGFCCVVSGLGTVSISLNNSGIGYTIINSEVANPSDGTK